MTVRIIIPNTGAADVQQNTNWSSPIFFETKPLKGKTAHKENLSKIEDMSE